MKQGLRKLFNKYSNVGTLAKCNRLISLDKYEYFCMEIIVPRAVDFFTLRRNFGTSVNETSLWRLSKVIGRRGLLRY
uniref:Uncharacterized protein n=1 Tax=Rhizophagus irregularis (strain DAOM 181602 / DAOM 197198 / MUCL 43194) TaxID=747089 RepID=U9UMG8_RHIID